MPPLRLLFGTDSAAVEAIRSAFASAGFDVVYRTEPGERTLVAERDAGWDYLILEHRPPERDAFRALQANEELYLRDRAIQALGQGILITDAHQADHPIIYASPSFEKLTGYSTAEVLGRNCRFLQGPETDRAAVRQVREALAAERPIRVRLRNYRKDGTPFWNELTIDPVRDENGRLTHFVGVQTDVTGRVELETQYYQAQKMEAIGKLAGGVAHDFNNLLTIINGYSDLALSDLPVDHPAHEMVRLIRRAGDRSAQLTRQLLAFSRQHVSAPRLVDLNRLLTDLEKMLRRIIGEDVELETCLGSQTPGIRADPAQVEQLVMNLAVNARDAMPTGGRLTIRTAARQVNGDAKVLGLAPGAYAALTVTDTGCGIAPEIHERIFEPFFTTKPAGKGTGLGLSVVHGIVKQSGGAIQVVSEPGAGTSFTILWPRCDAAEAPHTATVKAGLLRGTETLMLVEDDENVRALSRRVLASAGYAVHDFQSGEEALRAQQNGLRIRLLVTDVVMPGLTGRVVAERATALEPGVKVLYVSGYTDDEIMRHGVANNQLNFLQKPFSAQALLQKVRDVLDD